MMKLILFAALVGVASALTTCIVDPTYVTLAERSTCECPANCQTCENGSECKTVATGYFLAADKTAKACATGCATCTDATAATCTACMTGYTQLDDKTCAADGTDAWCGTYSKNTAGDGVECKNLVSEGYFSAQTAAPYTSATACATGCATCTDATVATCTVCKTGYTLATATSNA